MKEIKTVAYSMIGGMVVGLTSAYFAMPKQLRNEVKSAAINMLNKTNCKTTTSLKNN